MRKLTLVLALSVVDPRVSLASGEVSVAEEFDRTSVSEAEWSAAVPSLRSTPFLKRLNRPALNSTQPRPGMSAYAKVSSLIRPDGTVGVYRVIETNDPRFARDFIDMLLKERFEPPVLHGKPVSVRNVQAASIGWEL